METIGIGKYNISLNDQPFIVAEMSGNHNQSLNRALKIVEEAAKAGVCAIKLQTYTADTMTLNVNQDDFIINDPSSLWHGRHLYELYQEAHTPWDWHKPIFDKAKELGIVVFSTPFDSSAVDFLESLDVPAYKIASFENTDVNLIRKIARTGKPVIISTGLATLSDLQLMTNTLKHEGCEKFILLKCTSAYPASPLDANLKTIPHMASMFNCQVGLSDHTMGIGVAIAAVALGATVVEKHFCLSRSEGGVDSDFSLEPNELKSLVQETKRAWLALGKVNYQASMTEQKSKIFKRSIYFIKNMKAGEIIEEDCIRCIRPGYGLEPKYWDNIIGSELNTNVKIGDQVNFSILNLKKNAQFVD